jgi:hypothetical protein
MHQYRIVHTNTELCQLHTYLFVLGIPKSLQVCSNMYLVCALVCIWCVISMYWYVPGKTKKQMWVLLGIILIRTVDIMHSILSLNHYATSMHSKVIPMIKTRYIAIETYTYIACYLLAGVGRPSGSSSASGSCHEVTGPDIDLNFPDAHFCSGTGLQICNVVMDRRPTEKQAQVGELAGFTALSTH